jgi:hypothetical protein
LILSTPSFPPAFLLFTSNWFSLIGGLKSTCNRFVCWLIRRAQAWVDLLAEVEKDEGLTESLIPAGYIKFGKGPDMDYDPVCFDIKSRTKHKDYRVVKIDHEEILCNCRVKVVAELAPSFEQLVRQTIERANSQS